MTRSVGKHPALGAPYGRQQYVISAVYDPTEITPWLVLRACIAALVHHWWKRKSQWVFLFVEDISKPSWLQHRFRIEWTEQ